MRYRLRIERTGDEATELLVDWQGRLGVSAVGMAALETAGETATLVEAEAASAAIPFDDRAKAKMQGYEGDPCGECGNFTLVRNGTCLKCNTCGGTSGCS